MDTILTFLVEYYETLDQNIKAIDDAYSQDAVLVKFVKEEQPRTCRSNFYREIKRGRREILKYHGKVIDSNLFIDVASRLDEDLIDESFCCSVTDSTMLITYHSIHVKPYLKPLAAPKIEKAFRNDGMKRVANEIKPLEQPSLPPPEEVDSIKELRTKQCIIARNIPFTAVPSELIEDYLSKYGYVKRFYQADGLLIAEYDELDQLYQALVKESIDWKGRTVSLRRLPKDFRL